MVAQEVKSLANQTAKATEEIAGQIAHIQASTRDAVAAIRGIAGTIEEVARVVARIRAKLEGQLADLETTTDLALSTAYS